MLKLELISERAESIVDRTGNGEIRELSRLVAELARTCRDLERKVGSSPTESQRDVQPAG